MPKIKSLEAQEAYHEKMEELKQQRRSILAELFWPVVPKVAKEARPKATIASVVVETYKANGKDIRNDPFFQAHKDTFITVKAYMTHWADIKDVLAEEGKFICIEPGKGVYGSKNKAAITKTFEAHQHVIKASAERYNTRAELANKKRDMQLPAMAIQLQLPPPLT